ncbi:MAG: hypothetical protein ABIJ40_16845, partial [Bacteroidota bacterium]
DDDSAQSIGKMVKISVEAEYGDITRSSTVYISIPQEGYVPETVQAAVMVNGEVETSGNLMIDGRDHDKNEKSISSAGTVGLWASGTFSQEGNSKIGGTVDKLDYYPSTSPSSKIYQTSKSYKGGFPATPEEVLGGSAKGFGIDALKKYAKAGANGSQYVTDSKNLKYPLKGVTYVEPSEKGETWQSANISGSGILVVHASSGNSLLKNVNLGTFKGLVIVDEIVHLHTTILGALYVISPSPLTKQMLGNGNGSVLYSKETIKDAVGIVTGGGSKFGPGKRRLPIVAWYE